MEYGCKLCGITSVDLCHIDYKLYDKLSVADNTQKSKYSCCLPTF